MHDRSAAREPHCICPRYYASFWSLANEHGAQSAGFAGVYSIDAACCKGRRRMGNSPAVEILSPAVSRSRLTALPLHWVWQLFLHLICAWVYGMATFPCRTMASHRCLSSRSGAIDAGANVWQVSVMVLRFRCSGICATCCWWCAIHILYLYSSASVQCMALRQALSQAMRRF